MEETIEPKENFFKHVFNFDDETKSDYSYRESVPHVFAPENIGNYSSKIKSICDN